MKIEDWLKLANIKLKNSSPTALLDAEILLSEVINQGKAWIHTNPEYQLSDTHLRKLNKYLHRRQNHEPIAYIVGRQEFYGREFKVSSDTLQPRPETETMIELLLKQNLKQKNIVDVGTGSGCIAITTKLESPESSVIATEINPKALRIARANARKLIADISFFQGDLLECIPSTTEIHVVLANLPYVPDTHTINQAAMHEPKAAIFGGADGLDIYRRMFSQIDSLESKPQLVITESLPFQHTELDVVASKSGYYLVNSEDFIQVFEVY